MTAIEHGREIAIFQQLHAGADVHSSRVGRTFRVDSKGKVHSHHAAHIVVIIVAERLGQLTAVRFIDSTQIGI